MGFFKGEVDVAALPHLVNVAHHHELVQVAALDGAGPSRLLGDLTGGGPAEAVEDHRGLSEVVGEGEERHHIEGLEGLCVVVGGGGVGFCGFAELVEFAVDLVQALADGLEEVGEVLGGGVMGQGGGFLVWICSTGIRLGAALKACLSAVSRHLAKLFDYI